MKVTVRTAAPRINAIRIPGDNLATAIQWLHRNRWTVYTPALAAKFTKKGEAVDKAEIANRPRGDRPTWINARSAPQPEKVAWEKFRKGLEKMEGDYAKLCDAELQGFKSRLTNMNAPSQREAQEAFNKFKADVEKKVQAWRRGGGNWGRLVRILEAAT